jgi:hypothetical protein
MMIKLIRGNPMKAQSVLVKSCFRNTASFIIVSFSLLASISGLMSQANADSREQAAQISQPQDANATREQSISEAPRESTPGARTMSDYWAGPGKVLGPPVGNNYLVVIDAPEASKMGDAEATMLLQSSPTDGVIAQGSTCRWWEPCGVVHNRTGHSLYLSRDSSVHSYCNAKGPYAWLPNGSNSDTYLGWQDTDCFSGGGSYWVYYHLMWYGPWDWVRIWTHVWVY